MQFDRFAFLDALFPLRLGISRLIADKQTEPRILDSFAVDEA
ncbi:hypothetical protein [Sutterella sp.]